MMHADFSSAQMRYKTEQLKHEAAPKTRRLRWRRFRKAEQRIPTLRPRASG